MDNKLRKKALNILVKFPSISSYELANILCIDERQARKLIKNLPQDIIEENVRKIKKEKKEEKQEERLDKKSQIGVTLKGIFNAFFRNLLSKIISLIYSDKTERYLSPVSGNNTAILLPAFSFLAATFKK